MAIPRPVEPLLKAVREECDPERVVSSRYYRPEFGLPPAELRIYQAAEADWKRAMVQPPYIFGWRSVSGVAVEPIAPDDLPDYSVFPSGMYWPVGKIAFCIDSEHKRAVFTYVLGPRYACGYKVKFEDLNSAVFVPDRSRMVWMS